MKRSLVVFAWLLLACPCASAAQDAASAAALTRWVAAVREHTPGRPDAAAGAVAAMSYGDRRVLNPAMQVFLRALRTEPRNPQTKALADIVALARSVREDMGIAPFFRRAAILHGDVAIYREDFPAPPDDAPPPPPSRAPGSGLPLPAATPPLLYNARQVRHLDGNVVGDAVAEWNWPFARSLLDLLLSRPAIAQDGDRRFVSDWYHAVAAYLFEASHHGDLRLHLEDATRVLPDDARLLFDRGCFAELLGLPVYQTLSDDAPSRVAMARVGMEVPDATSTDAHAEEMFRRALQIDPGYAEARVRLARLLEGRGRHDEAAEEIDRALAGALDRESTFYARLFGGRIALARGRPQEALAHYRAASSLYPDAQSALLGASQAAVIASDLPAALSFVQRLAARPADATPDPWWRYRWGPGRDVVRLLADVYALSLSGGPPRLAGYEDVSSRLFSVRPGFVRTARGSGDRAAGRGLSLGARRDRSVGVIRLADEGDGGPAGGARRRRNGRRRHRERG